jgi:predicted phage terminase large subunit-like protein
LSDISLNLHLHPAQMEVYRCPKRFIVLAAGRRFGKSDLALKRALTSALDPRNSKKKPVWVIAPVQPQAKAIYWRPLLELAHPVVKSAHINDGIVELVNGVQIGIKGSDRPDTLRGLGLWDAVLDEFASMKPETWEEIIRPALSDVLGRALFIGTPYGRNHFHKLYMAAKSGLDPDWAAFHFTSADNPFLPAGEVEAAKRTMPTAVFRQEYMASFETGSTDLFKRDWIKYSSEEPKEGDWYVAVDLAGFSDATSKDANRRDYSAIAVVKITPTGDWWVKKIVYGRWNVEETARKIVSEYQDVEPLELGIEKGALFNAVSPHLVGGAAKRGLPLRVIPLSHENKSKADRITWALQGRFEHGRITLNNGDWNNELEDQLLNFPSKQVHDDLPDALSMIAQLAENKIFDSFGHVVDEPYWQPMDAVVGF